MENDKSSTVLQNRNEKSTIYSMDGSVVLGFIQQGQDSEGFIIESDVEAIGTFLKSKLRGVNLLKYDLSLSEYYIYLYYTKTDGGGSQINVAESVLISGPLAAELGPNDQETHTCDGSCGGANTIFNTCSEFDFVYRSGKIVGCKCMHPSGFCCHSKSKVVG
jgi:hypothetical protein